MMKLFLAGLLWLWCEAPVSADVTVRLNNYDSDAPIFAERGRLEPVGELFIQIFGGPDGGPWVTITNGSGQAIFRLSEPGFFDAGLGVVPGATEGALGFFTVRAWRREPTYEMAGSERVEDSFTQGLLGGGPIVLQMRRMTIGIPEPSTYVLGLLGVGVLLAARRFRR